MTIAITGEIPTYALICDVTEKDQVIPLDSLPWPAQEVLWKGCIDAPDCFPAGSMRWAKEIGPFPKFASRSAA
jgi:hypothetical protein